MCGGTEVSREVIQRSSVRDERTEFIWGLEDMECCRLLNGQRNFKIWKLTINEIFWNNRQKQETIIPMVKVLKG